MNYSERKKKLAYLLELIEKGHCFSTKEMAQKFNCSKRTIKRLIDELRDEGHSIEYSRSLKKFQIKN